MKLGCVLTACNLNPLYCDFIPLFIRAWKKLYPSIDVKIVLVAEAIPDKFAEYASHIILFPPITGISDAFISQSIRLLYPAVLSTTDAVLISDMDILPMNNTYYSKPLEGLSDSKFVHYRNGRMIEGGTLQYAMCYNAATPAIWAEITGIRSVDDIKSWLSRTYTSVSSYTGVPGGPGWFSDQIILYKMVDAWANKGLDLVFLKDTAIGFRRLDRIYKYDMNVVLPMIHAGAFSDYHCYRPYSAHKEINDMIVENLPDSSS